MMVISGMSDMAQMEDNISAMKEFEPLSETELTAVNKVREITYQAVTHLGIGRVFPFLKAVNEFLEWLRD